MHRIYLLLHIHVYIYPHHRDSFARDTHLLSFQHSSSATWHCVEILIRQDLICPNRPTINQSSHDRPCTHPQAATHKTRDNGVVQDSCPAPSPIITLRPTILDDHSEPQLLCLHRPSITDNLEQVSVQGVAPPAEVAATERPHICSSTYRTSISTHVQLAESDPARPPVFFRMGVPT